MQVRERLFSEFNQEGVRIAAPNPIWVNVYVEVYPTAQHSQFLKNLNIESFMDSWTPSTFNHLYGFFLAKLPAGKLVSALALKFIKRIDSAERQALPQNNIAYRAIMADSVWAKGYSGSGVKLAILDSGLDTDPTNSDLPTTFEKQDYWNYPTLDNDVENKVTGHGTHVTGSVLGRGVLSAGNMDSYNGTGAYKGMAPSADLIFLKIGNDTDGSASFAAIEAAMTAAVSIYHAEVITMSYGGWDTYHDGSESMDQKADWCYEQGVPVFISAGNEANKAKHCSGTVGAGSQSDFIPVNVWSAGVNNTKLNFNLVWYDGLDDDHTELTLEYYNASQVELTDVTYGSSTESLRGTESQVSYYNPYLPSGSGTYYLKVVNSSASQKFFHLYEDWNNGKVKFDTVSVPNCTVPDPEYTVSSPATADHAFSVGAYTSRTNWKDYTLGNYWTYGYTLHAISPFSSRGPRVDGVQKPDGVAPGSAIISMRDRDVYTSANAYWIDNDGSAGGDANYYVMQGTSMACPIAAGAAALLLQKDPFMTPEEVYNTLRNYARHDSYTGTCPNSTWGYGKLNIDSSFTSSVVVEIKMFLEGPYNALGDSMDTALNRGGDLPKTSPYSEDPRTVSTVPSGVVDWVLIQLRTKADSAAVTSRSAFLRKDGMVVADDGIQTRINMNAPEGDYYLVVKHRNHLAVMSSAKVRLYSN